MAAFLAAFCLIGWGGKISAAPNLSDPDGVREWISSGVDTLNEDSFLVLLRLSVESLERPGLSRAQEDSVVGETGISLDPRDLVVVREILSVIQSTARRHGEEDWVLSLFLRESERRGLSISPEDEEILSVARRSFLVDLRLIRDARNGGLDALLSFLVSVSKRPGLTYAEYLDSPGLLFLMTLQAGLLSESEASRITKAGYRIANSGNLQWAIRRARAEKIDR